MVTNIKTINGIPYKTNNPLKSKKEKYLYTDKYLVKEDEEGWKLTIVVNHLEHKFWYEILTPYGTYLHYTTENIYEAINRIHNEKMREWQV